MLVLEPVVGLLLLFNNANSKDSALFHSRLLNGNHLHPWAAQTTAIWATHFLLLLFCYTAKPPLGLGTHCADQPGLKRTEPALDELGFTACVTTVGSHLLGLVRSWGECLGTTQASACSSVPFSITKPSMHVPAPNQTGLFFSVLPILQCSCVLLQSAFVVSVLFVYSPMGKEAISGVCPIRGVWFCFEDSILLFNNWYQHL